MTRHSTPYSPTWDEIDATVAKYTAVDMAKRLLELEHQSAGDAGIAAQRIWGMNMPPLADMSDEALAGYIWKNLDPSEGEAVNVDYLACMLKEHRRQCAQSATADTIAVPRDLLNAAACAVNRDRWACSREADTEGEEAMAALHDQISLLLLAPADRKSSNG